MEKYTVYQKFYDWIMQKPGLEWINYGNSNLIRQEYRHIAQQKERALQALTLFGRLDYNKSQLRDAMRSFSGRLKFDSNDNLDYCTGQYWPTEYRLSAAVVLEAYAWNMTRFNRKSCFTIFKVYNKNVKRMIKYSMHIAKKLSELDMQDYQSRNKILDKVEHDNKPEMLYNAIVGLAYQYKDILYKES